MSLSLKESASQLLKWNIKGQEFARALRGSWIIRKNGKCTACKIGMVMIGRYGLEKALTYGSSTGTGLSSRLNDTLTYGPRLACPIRGCDASVSDFRSSFYAPDPKKQPLGVIIEHLFEYHKRSIMWIDKYLAELAEEELRPA